MQASTKASKRNLRKKVSKKAKIEKETTPTLNIGGDRDDKSNQYDKDNLPQNEREEIFYNPYKVS